MAVWLTEILNLWTVKGTVSKQKKKQLYVVAVYPPINLFVMDHTMESLKVPLEHNKEDTKGRSNWDVPFVH